MLRKIIISNFKNFTLFEAEFDRINIIKGRNGAGKTNLLEGVYICLNGHPFVKNYSQIQKDSKKPAILSAETDKGTVLVRFDGPTKTIKLNSKPAKVIDLKEKFPCIDYSINSFMSFKSKDYLFSLIDKGIYATYREILPQLMEYNKLQRIKRKLLKWENQIDLLVSLNEKVKSVMYKISEKREEFCDTLNSSIGECFNQFYHSSLTIKYNISSFNNNVINEEIKRQRIIASLKRDSVRIEINGRNILFSSVGERKIALLCIVLSIIKVYNSNSKMPVFLIDDLEGDLDKSAQKKVFETIESLPNQILLTTLGVFDGYNTINLDER